MLMDNDDDNTTGKLVGVTTSRMRHPNQLAVLKRSYRLPKKKLKRRNQVGQDICALACEGRISVLKIPFLEKRSLRIYLALMHNQKAELQGCIGKTGCCKFSIRNSGTSSVDDRWKLHKIF